MKDIEAGRANGLNEGLIDRLALDEGRISGIAEGLRQIAALPDPIGETVWGAKRPNGLAVTKVRVPLGVIGVIYEARPNVTADAAGLCIKSGNAVILRGGKEAFNSNMAIVKVMQEAGYGAGLPEGFKSIWWRTPRERAQRRLCGLMNTWTLLSPEEELGLLKRWLRTQPSPQSRREREIATCMWTLPLTLKWRRILLSTPKLKDPRCATQRKS